MSNPTARRAVQMMHEILVSLDETITKKLYEMVFEFNEYNEPGVAYDLLCSELYEYDTAIPAATWQLLSELGELMNLRPYYLDQIRILD